MIYRLALSCEEIACTCKRKKLLYLFSMIRHLFPRAQKWVLPRDEYMLLYRYDTMFTLSHLCISIGTRVNDELALAYFESIQFEGHANPDLLDTLEKCVKNAR